jgi:predicted transcriptional regulator YdeE
MTVKTSHPTIEELLNVLPEGSRDVVSGLHAALIEHGCTHKVELGEADGATTIRYSGMNCDVRVDNAGVTLLMKYDVRAFLDFYRHRADEATKALLFEAAIPCCFCISDKCTTLLTDRRIYLGSKAKQLCGPYRHSLELPVTGANVGLMKPVIDMAFRYCTPEMHRDVFYHNEVSYRVEAGRDFYVVGFGHRSTLFSVRTEDFIQQCFEEDEDGRTKLDVLRELTGQVSGRIVGVTQDFVDGLHYVYVLGVPCDDRHLPDALPGGVVAVRIGAGDYAVYNSSAGDYKSIWQHFKDRFFDGEQKGYDTSRLPFEFLDDEGRAYDVSIPVAAGLPKENGRRTRVIKTPDTQIAGFLDYAETDYPLYKDVPNINGKLRALFPSAGRYILASIHAMPGQPIFGEYGVEVDKLDVIPEGVEVMTLRGGYWHAVSYPYPVAGDFIFEAPYETPYAIDCLHHPRAWVEIIYDGRGPYTDVYSPIRRMGQRVVELVERPVSKLIGKEAALPEKVIAPEDIDTFYDLEANPEKGSCTFAFRFEMHNKMGFYAKPVIKGVEVAQFDTLCDDVPEGMETFTLEGGRYVKVTETVPNGEMDWTMPEWALFAMADETGYEPDLERLFYVRQTGYGRAFELYVPVK